MRATNSSIMKITYCNKSYIYHIDNITHFIDSIAIWTTIRLLPLHRLWRREAPSVVSNKKSVYICRKWICWQLTINQNEAPSLLSHYWCVIFLWLSKSLYASPQKCLLSQFLSMTWSNFRSFVNTAPCNYFHYYALLVYNNSSKCYQ